MSILTGLVIVVAMATLAQRSDDLIDFFLRERAAMIAPADDSVIAAAGETLLIDVLANDLNVIEADRANLRIVASPSCGAAEVAEAGILYVANDLCVGEQVFSYCASRGDSCPVAFVRVAVQGPGAAREPSAAASGQTAETALLAQPAISEKPAEPKAEAGGPEPEAGPGPEPDAAPSPPRHSVADIAAPTRGPADEQRLASPAPGAAPAETPRATRPAADALATAEEGRACPPAIARSTPAPGGASRVHVLAPCAAGAVAALDHRDVAFPVPLDAKGEGWIDLPVLDAAEGATLRLPAGEALPVPLAFDEAELSRIVRVAIASPAAARLHLHAFEYAAAPGGPGHVRSGGAPGDGAGRVESFAAPPGAPAAAGLSHVEVYSLRLGAGGRRGVARLALDPAAGACGAGGATEYLVIRAEGGKVRGAVNGSLAAASCDASAGLAARLAAGAVTELRIE